VATSNIEVQRSNNGGPHLRRRGRRSHRTRDPPASGSLGPTDRERPPPRSKSNTTPALPSKGISTSVCSSRTNDTEKRPVLGPLRSVYVGVHGCRPGRGKPSTYRQQGLLPARGLDPEPLMAPANNSQRSLSTTSDYVYPVWSDKQKYLSLLVPDRGNT